MTRSPTGITGIGASNNWRIDRTVDSSQPMPFCRLWISARLPSILLLHAATTLAITAA